MPCMSADLTTHAVKTFHPVGVQNGEACAPRRAKRCEDEKCKRRRCARILGLALSWLDRRDDSNVRTCALFSVGSTTKVSTAINMHERCGTREDQAHRHNGNAQWQHCGCGRPSFEHSERFASSAPLSHQQVRRARARRRTICSPESVRRLSEWAKALGFEVISPAS